MGVVGVDIRVTVTSGGAGGRSGRRRHREIPGRPNAIRSPEFCRAPSRYVAAPSQHQWDWSGGTSSEVGWFVVPPTIVHHCPSAARTSSELCTNPAWVAEWAV